MLILAPCFPKQYWWKKCFTDVKNYWQINIYGLNIEPTMANINLPLLAISGLKFISAINIGGLQCFQYWQKADIGLH
jgi:hypothetical protein